MSTEKFNLTTDLLLLCRKAFVWKPHKPAQIQKKKKNSTGRLYIKRYYTFIIQYSVHFPDPLKPLCVFLSTTTESLLHNRVIDSSAFCGACCPRSALSPRTCSSTGACTAVQPRQTCDLNLLDRRSVLACPARRICVQRDQCAIPVTTQRRRDEGERKTKGSRRSEQRYTCRGSIVCVVVGDRASCTVCVLQTQGPLSEGTLCL